MAVDVDVQVWDRTNQTLIRSLTHGEDESEVRQVRDLTGNDTGDEEGEGTLVIDHDHPGLSALADGRVVRVLERDPGDDDETYQTKFAFLVEDPETVEKPPSKSEGDRVVTVTGPGPLARLKEGRTLGTLPTSARPQSKRRLWGANCPELPRGAWTTPYVQMRQDQEPYLPYHWPSPYAMWMWTRPEPPPLTPHPIEGAWFWREFVVDETTDVKFLHTADDSFRVFIHGVEIDEQERDWPSDIWQKPWRGGIRLEPGTYSYVMYAHTDAVVGGALAEAWPTDIGGITGAPFLLSGVPGNDLQDYLETATGLPPGSLTPVYGTWKCLIQPDDQPFPGCTRGLILNRYLWECHQRDELLEVTTGFTNTHDSNGDPWEITSEVDFDNDGDLYDAVEKLRETDIDAWMDLDQDGFVLQATNRDARGSTGVFTVPDNQVVSHKRTEVTTIENDVIVNTDKGPVMVRDETSIAEHGLRPGGVINAGKLVDPMAAQRLGQAYLAPRSQPGESHSFKLTPMTEFAGRPGDSGTVAGIEGLRVSAVGFELERGGRLHKAPQFETPWERRRRQAARVADRVVREAGQIVGSSRIIDGGTRIPTGPIEPVKLCTYDWNESEELDPDYWDEWDPGRWQAFLVEEKLRLCRVTLIGEYLVDEDTPDEEQVTTGPTTFQVLLNGAPISFGPWTVTMGSTERKGSSPLWGRALIVPGDELSISTTANGGHINGSVTLWGSTPL